MTWTGRESPAEWEASGGFGGHALVGGEDATLLRHLRADHVAAGRAPGPILAREAGVVWASEIREALPYEDEHGLVRPAER